jgi:hypothetical protein
MEREVPLRITLVRPPTGVTFALQRGKTEIVSPARSRGEDLAFDFELRVKQRPDGRPNFLGPFAHGTPDVRFVYVNAGTCAGEAGSPWTRRVKVQLGGIAWPLVEAALADPEAVLVVRIAGTAKDGGPACATVPLLDGGWRLLQIKQAAHGRPLSSHGKPSRA